MNKFLKRLEKNGIIIGDGAMGTMLQACGLSSGHAPEEWIISRPEMILKVHQDYIKAGSQLIEANTFGANRIKLKAAGLENSLRDINKKAVELARRAAGYRIVAGAVGPTGKLMKPYGELSFSEAKEVFQEQIEIQAEAGIDVVIIETMSDLQEIKAAVIAAKKVGLPVIAQMTFNEDQVTLFGSPPEVVAVVLDGLGVDLIGVNCTPGVEKTLPLIRKMAETIDKPLSVHPNAGLPRLQGGQVDYPETPEDFSRFVRHFLDNNVRLIGGCCGSTPEFIKQIKEEVNKYLKQEGKEKGSLVEDKIYLASNRTFLEFINGDSINSGVKRSRLMKGEALTEYMKEENWAAIRKEARERVKAGAELIDLIINIEQGIKLQAVKRMINELQQEVQVPLAVDTADLELLEVILKEYRGRLLINPVGKETKQIHSLAKEYGAVVERQKK